jgi:2,3-bisphosphoglycerate-independent phosphoglycerate mutase
VCGASLHAGSYNHHLAILHILVPSRYFGGRGCLDALLEGARATAKLIDSMEFAKLEEDFLLCSDVEHEKDLWVLQSNLMGNVQVRCVCLCV